MAQDETQEPGMTEIFGIKDDPFSMADEAAEKAGEPSTLKVLADAEEEPAAEAPKETSSEDEADEEAKPEEKASEEEKKEEEPAAPVVPEELKAIFPDAKDSAEIAASVVTLRDDLKAQQDANEEMKVLLKKHPAIIPMLKAVRDGKPFYEAVRENMGLSADEEIPDPKEDPEAYHEYVKKQVELETKMKRDEEERVAFEKDMTAATAEAEKQKADFQSSRKLSDADMGKFLDHVGLLLNGDPKTRRLPKTFLEQMWRAYTYDDAKKEANAQGQVSGRNDAIDKLVHKKDVKGDGIAHIRSGGTIQKVIVDGLEDLDQSLTTKKSIFDIR